MAEDLPLSSSDAPADSGNDPAVEQARESFERAAEKAGVPIGEGGEGGRETVRTRKEPAAPAAEPVLDGDKASTAFRERLDRRRQERYLSALEKVAERALRETPEPAAAPAVAAAPATNPHDRETDYWSWLEWENKAMREGIVSSLDEKLKPVLSFFEEQQAERQREAEWRQQQGQRSAWFEQHAGVAKEAHEAYVATTEGSGYMDRVLWHVGDPGHPGDPARGIPARQPVDGALTLGWLAAGFPEETARQLAIAHVHGMQQLALNHGLNPAVALDRFTRAQIAAAAPFYLGQGNGNGNGAAAAAPPASAARRRVAGMKQTAGSAVAGAVTESGPKAGGDLNSHLRNLASTGNLGTEELRDLARRFYGSDNRQALQKLAKALREEQAALRESA